MYSMGLSNWYRGPRISSVRANSTKTIDTLTITKTGSGFKPLATYTDFEGYKTTWGAPDSSKKIGQNIIVYFKDGIDSIRYLYSQNPTLTNVVKDSTYLNLPLEPLGATYVSMMRKSRSFLNRFRINIFGF
jgi:hypothetical protein